MNISAEWAGVVVASLGISITVVGWLLSSILVVLKGIRQDIKEVASRVSDAETRLSVVEELLKRLKCQRCENG
jgi:hypothetical protein